MKVQGVKRKRGDAQLYVNIPAAVARALGLSEGEQVEWSVGDAKHLVLHREGCSDEPQEQVKKTLLMQRFEKNFWELWEHLLNP